MRSLARAAVLSLVDSDERAKRLRIVREELRAGGPGRALKVMLTGRRPADGSSR